MNKNFFLLMFSCFLLVSCEIENLNYLKPIMITNEPQSVLTNSAILGGRALGEGGKDITEYGVVWSENFPPTVNDNKIIEGERLGYFSNLYENFQSNTTYYYCAYGISEVGIGYGRIYEFTTTPEPSCQPMQENVIDLGRGLDQDVVGVGTVRYTEDSIGFGEGNMEFQIGFNGSSATMYINFEEKDRNLPRTGMYICVNDFRENDSQSNGNAILRISDFGLGGVGGARAEEGVTFYVENINDVLTFIFCDTELTDGRYILNGKFNYPRF